MKESYHNESGLTLVEILASIVILSIVIMTFLMVFSQSAKTTQRSEKTVEATYIAQKEMENLYELSRTKTFEEAMNRPEVTIIQDSKWDQSYEYTSIDANHRIIVNFDYLDEELNGMTRVLIEVVHIKDSNQVEAQMENLFKWKD